MEGRTQQIQLGIALDYPVHWGFERILRDLIQNFYDSIGYADFGKEFHYSYEVADNGDYQVTMETRNHPFDYEWLVYIGGSTKTEAEGCYIGKYGEGFKICMLSLLKMGVTDITMHSKDWMIRPCSYVEEVDDTSVSMLAYDMMHVADDGLTSLVIRGIKQEYKRILDEGLLHFFYPENPLFGDKIGEGDGYIIYGSSGMRVPCTQHLNFNGILYLNYLARGRLSLPFFVLLTGKYLEDGSSRKRQSMKPFYVWESMYRLARRMSPEDSMGLLIQMRSFWNDLPEKVCDCRTYYYVICQLVRNIGSSPEITEAFKRQYPDLVYIDRLGSDKKKDALIRQVRVWARTNNHKMLVNPVFRLLGAVSLLDQFRLGNEGLKPADADQIQMIGLLSLLYEGIVPSAFQVDIPEVWIGTKKKANGDPLCYADKDFWERKKIKYQRHHLQKIVMCDSDFEADAYEETLVSFLDKMLHVFGSSRSSLVNAMLTNLGAWMIDQADLIERGRKKWKELSICRQ